MIMDNLQNSIVDQINKDSKLSSNVTTNNLSNTEPELGTYRCNTPTYEFDEDYDDAFNDLDDTEPIVSSILNQIIAKSVMNDSSMTSIETSDSQSTKKLKHKDIAPNYDPQHNNIILEESTITKQICLENIYESENSVKDAHYCDTQKDQSKEMKKKDLLCTINDNTLNDNPKTIEKFGVEEKHDLDLQNNISNFVVEKNCVSELVEPISDKESSSIKVQCVSEMGSISTDKHKNNFVETCMLKEKIGDSKSLDENKSPTDLNKSVVDNIELELSKLLNGTSSDTNEKTVVNDSKLITSNNFNSVKLELEKIFSDVNEIFSPCSTSSSPVTESTKHISDVISKTKSPMEDSNLGINAFDDGVSSRSRSLSIKNYKECIKPNGSVSDSSSINESNREDISCDNYTQNNSKSISSSHKINFKDGNTSCDIDNKIKEPEINKISTYIVNLDNDGSLVQSDKVNTDHGEIDINRYPVHNDINDDRCSIQSVELSTDNVEINHEKSFVQSDKINSDSANMNDSFSEPQEDFSKHFEEIGFDEGDNQNNESKFAKNVILQVTDNLDVPTNVLKHAEKTNDVLTISNLTNNEECSSLIVQDMSEYKYSNKETVVADSMASTNNNKNVKSNLVSKEKQIEDICLKLSSIISEHIRNEVYKSSLIIPLLSKSKLIENEHNTSDLNISKQLDKFAPPSTTEVFTFVGNVINYVVSNKTSLTEKIVKAFDMPYDEVKNTSITHKPLESSLDISFDTLQNEYSYSGNDSELSSIDLHSNRTEHVGCSENENCQRKRSLSLSPIPPKDVWIQMMKDFNEDIRNASGAKKNVSRKKVLYKPKTETYLADIQVKDSPQSDSNIEDKPLKVKKKNSRRCTIKPSCSSNNTLNTQDTSNDIMQSRPLHKNKKKLSRIISNVKPSLRCIKRPNYNEEFIETNSSISTKKSPPRRLKKISSKSIVLSNPIKTIDDSSEFESTSESENSSKTSTCILPNFTEDKTMKKNLRESSHILKPTYSRKRVAGTPISPPKAKIPNCYTSSEDESTAISCVSNSSQVQVSTSKKSTRRSKSSIVHANSFLESTQSKKETPKSFKRTLSKKRKLSSDYSSDDAAPSVKKNNKHSTDKKTREKKGGTSGTKNLNIDECSPNNEAKCNK